MPNVFDEAESELKAIRLSNRTGTVFDEAEAELKRQSNHKSVFDEAESELKARRNPEQLSESSIGIASKETAKDLRQMGAQFVRGAAGMAASVPESLGIVAHHMSGGMDASGNPVPLEDVELYKAGQAIRRGAQWVAPVDENRPHKFAVDTLGQGAGSMAGAIGGGLIGGAAKLPAWVGVATTGATSQGVDAFDEAKAKGADDQTAWLTFLLNAGAGTSEAWLGPVAKWLDRANRSTHGAIRRAIREGAEEMGQELFQQISQNAIAQQLYDPDRPWLEGAGESSAAGLTLGTLGGLLFRGHAPRESSRRSSTAPSSPQPEGRLPSRLPNDMEPVAGPDRPLPTAIPETPALQGPVAVFRGTRGEDLRVQIGTAGLDASKEYAMRVWPGAEFVGVEGEQATPAPENPTTTNPTEGGESHVQTQEGRQEGVLTPAPTTEADASANAPAPLAGQLTPDEQAQAQADLEATQSDPFADLTPENPATQQPNEATDSAGKARERRGKGAVTTQSEPTDTPVRVARGSSLRTRFARETDTMGEDILSWISDNGRMMSRSAAQRSKSKEWWSKNKSLYDDAVKLKSPHHGIFYGGEQTPDQVAEAAYRAGILKVPDVTALWQAIDKASTGRSGGVKAAKAEQEWIKSESEAQQNWQKATESGAIKINASELTVGDVLEVEGERIKVTAVDPDTLDVTLQDGRKFGTQTVTDGSTLHVEKLEHDEGGDWKVPSSSKPKEFSLDAPESVEQQKARQAAEQQQQAQQQAKAKLDALAAQPLTGNAGDLGQKDMFAPPEDLWAMQESGPIDNRKPQDQSTPSNETGRQNARYKESVGQSQIQRLTEELRANSRANQEAQPGTSDYAAAYAGLLDLAQRTGRILPRDILPKHPIGQGQEHVVWWAPNHQRVFKSTLPNHFGLAIGKSTALTYLERMALQNEVFGDDIRFEGVVLDGQRMRIVTSQPAVVGSEVSESEAAAAMQRFGFVAGEISGQPIWYHPTGNVLAYDAHTRNFIKTKEGIVVPIDVILQYPTEDIRNALRSATGQDSLQDPLLGYDAGNEIREPGWKRRARDPYQLELGISKWTGGNQHETDRQRIQPDQRRSGSVAVSHAEPELTIAQAAAAALSTGSAQEWARAFALTDTVSSIDPSIAPSGAPQFNIVGRKIETPLDFALAQMPLRSPHQESLKVALLNNDGVVVHSEVLYTGIIDTVTLRPADFARLWHTFGKKASRMIMAHNHPGGDPSASDADMHVTTNLRRLAETVGFELFDHVITNGTKFTSMRLGWQLQHIPNATLAPWEHLPRIDLKRLDSADGFAQFVATLRQGDPSNAHVIFLTTRRTVTAVHRIPIATSWQAWEKALSAAMNAGASNGAKSMLVDFGPALDDVTVKDPYLSMRRLGRQYEIELLDASWKGTPSARSSGLVREAAQELTGPESVANALLDESGGVAQDIAAEQRSDESVQRLKRINQRAGEAGFVINPATMIADLLVAGAKMLKRGGQWVMSKASWVSAMVKAYGEKIRQHLDGVWSRLARIQNQQANGVGPTAQGHLNAIESLAGKTNIPEEQRPVYGPEVAAAGKPSMLTKVRPVSQQIRILGGQDLLKAKQRRDVLEATQAAAVKSQSDQLWSDLVKSAREANPLRRWHLPDWMIATPRARAFKQRAIHIAARLNAVSRQDNGSFQFKDFVMRAGSMTTQEANRNKVGPGSEIFLNDPITGQQESLTVGQLVTPPSGGAFYQLHREVDAQTQQELYEHFAREYPEMIWFLDMFIDPKLANTRTTINGVEIPVFNRFASAAMMADDDPNFQPLTAYTPDVLVTRSLVGSVRSALSFKAGTRSPGRKYKSGTSREGGHVRDLLSGFNVRTWQMLAEKSRKQWMQAVLQAATPIRKNQIPNGWVKLETGMEDLWQAVKRLRNWKSPESWRPLKQSEIDELDEVEAKLGPNERIAKRDGRYFLVVTLFPETQARMTEKGIIEDEQLEYRKFFGEALALRGRQLMLPQALVDQLISRYAAHVEHGSLYRTAAWMVRNSVGLWLVAPVTYVNNVLTNDLFTVEAATRRILSGIANGDMHDLRFSRELAIAEGFKWFPGLRRLVDGQFRDAVDAVLPDNVFANQTALADLKIRLDEDPMSHLRRGELASAALQFIRYGNIDINSKRRMAFAWLRAQATTNARKAGLRGEALRSAVNGYLRNPPVDDRAAAIEIANFELLNYADSPEWLERFSANPASRLVMPFPRFGYHYIAKNATRAAALKDLLGKVPQKQRAEAFADFVTFLMFPAGGLGLLAHLLFGGDDDDARKLVGTSQTKERGPDGEIIVKPMDRSLVTANRVNLTGWASQLGLGDPNRETDFWLRVRSYPVVSMAGAAVLAMNDTKKFGPKEGAMTYARAAMDLASDFFSVGMAVKVPDKMVQTLSDRSGGKNPPQMVTDPYGTRVPFLAYLTDQTLETFLPGSRQADMVIRWLDPVQRRRAASKALDFKPSMWDAARVGHWTGLLDRLWSGGPSTLPPEGPVKRGFVEPQSYPLTQRVAELGGFNIRPIDRRAYEEAIKLGPRW